MLIDARSLVEEVIETEVCIVGTGPAGMALAQELAGQDFRVCLLESGGLKFDSKAHSLNEGEIFGGDFAPLNEQRQRQFGGTANKWKVKLDNNQVGVRHLPLDEIDFEKREGLPYSGWPFSKSQLDPFYERAQSVCKIGSLNYEAEAWADAQSPQLPFQGNRVNTTMFKFGPQNVFLQEYRDKIALARNITTYYNASVVEIETNETATTVTRVRVASLEGNEFWVSAKVFILATGGIENARLLLLSNKTQKEGLGNQNDVVGRFFMDHPLVTCGMFIPANRQIFNTTALYDLRRVNGVAVMGKLTLNQEVMRRENLLNISSLLFPRPKPYQCRAAKSFNALRAARSNPAMRKHAFKNLLNAITGIDYIIPAIYGVAFQQQPFFPDLGKGGWSSLQNNHRRFVTFEIIHQTEQAPDPDNRVTLGTERDRLGCRQAQLHWHWGQTDIRSVMRSQEILQAEIAHAGLGQLQLYRDGELPILQAPGTNHHTGTTRMHVDPKQGVVDQNCQVHNVSNLFIAGSSVFPTSGYANPTLTIVALAIRLADKVKAVMAHKPASLVQLNC